MSHYSRVVLFLVAASFVASNVYADTNTDLAQAASGSSVSSGSGSSSSSAQPATQMSVNQFQAWLQNNGYKQNSGQAQPSNAGAASNASRPSGSINWNKRRVMSYEEAQKSIVATIPNSSQPPNPDSEIAFDNVLQRNIPMTPQQVVRLHQQVDLEQRAAAMPPNIPPRPVSSTLMINLAPGTTPPAIRLAQGYVSSLVFVDSTGAPWPIASYDIGNPKAMNIQWDGKSNILLLQAVSPYSDGDIVVSLRDLPTPITLELVSGQRVVDYRADIHVSGIGPNTKEMPLGTNLPNSANQLLLGVLDGIAPAGSRQLLVSGADCQAWLLGDEIYFRTQLTVLSPGWIGKMTSPDGMQAYQLPKTSSILVSKYGEPVELKVEGL